MNRNTATYEMLTGTVDCASRHVGQYPNLSSEALTELEKKVKELSEQKATAIAAESLVQVSLAARDAAFESLKTELGWVSKLAATLDNQDFRLPSKVRKTDLVSVASAFLKLAPSMKDVLAAHRFPENFVEGIETKISELNRTYGEYRNARRKYSASVRSGETLIREAVAAVKRFDVVAAITFSGDPSALAEYEMARTVRRAPERKEVPEDSAASPAPVANGAAV
jgi:hypothetical protein